MQDLKVIFLDKMLILIYHVPKAEFEKAAFISQTRDSLYSMRYSNNEVLSATLLTNHYCEKVSLGSSFE